MFIVAQVPELDKVERLGTIANTVSGLKAPKQSGGGTGASVLSQEEVGRQARLRRWELQNHAARLLPTDRVAACLRRQAYLAEQIEIRYRPDVQAAHYRGLQTCGSVWHCPICAAKISERRREELAGLVEKHIAAGGSVWMTTYTIRHKRYDNLADLLQRFLEARRRVRQGRRGIAWRRDYQVIGTVSVLEVTWSKENGWHPHVHELVFSAAADFDPDAFDQAVRPLWREAARSQGLKMNGHGFQVDRTYGAVADYIAKYGHEPAKEPWGVEAEMSKGHLKRGRAERHYTPFALLDAIADGHDRLAPRWQEYANVFKGRKQLNYSPGLKAFYAEAETDDAELAAQGETSEALTLVQLLPWQWGMVVEANVRGGLLELARLGNVGEIVAGLAEIGVEVEPCVTRGWWVATPAGPGEVLSVVLDAASHRWRCSVLLVAEEPGIAGRWRGYDLLEVQVVGGPASSLAWVA